MSGYYGQSQHSPGYYPSSTFNSQDVDGQYSQNNPFSDGASAAQSPDNVSGPYSYQQNLMAQPSQSDETQATSVNQYSAPARYEDQNASESSTSANSRPAQQFSFEITTSANPQALYQDAANARNQGRASGKAANISRCENALGKIRFKSFIDESCRDCLYNPTNVAVAEAERLCDSYADLPDIFDGDGALLRHVPATADILVVEFSRVTLPGKKRKTTSLTSRFEKPSEISRRECLYWS